jgi:hypothetical protein
MKENMMKLLAAVPVVTMLCCSTVTVTSAQPDACKLCREDYDACVKAHTKLACKTNMNICINHCRPTPKSPSAIRR